MDSKRNMQLPKRFGYMNNGEQNVVRKSARARFEGSLKEMKKLNTFVDLRGEITSLNFMQQNPYLINKVKQSQEQDKRMSELRQKDTKSNFKRYGQQLEIELDVLEHLDEETIPHVLDLLNLEFSAKQINTMQTESSSLLNTHYKIHKIQEIIKKKSKPLIICDQIIEDMSKIGILSARNSDEQNFYEEVLKQPKRFDPEQQDDKITTTQKYKFVLTYLKEHGINIEIEEPVPQEQYLNDFKRRSDLLITKMNKQQLKKHGMLSSRNSEKSTLPSISEMAGTMTTKSTYSKLQIPKQTTSYQEFMKKIGQFHNQLKFQTPQYQTQMTQMDQQIEQPLIRHQDDFIDLKYEKEEHYDNNSNVNLKPKSKTQRRKIRLRKIFFSDL